MGNDTVFDRGDLTRDYLNGGDGNDTLKGDTGDILNGGTGADVFSLMEAAQVSIEDYNPAEDTIEITYAGALPLLSTAQTEDGLALLADGEAVAVFANLDQLDLGQVRLVAA